MSSQSDGDICVFCRQGRVTWRNQEVAFRQLTDRGYVCCRVTIQTGICAQCGAKSLGDRAEAIMDEAVRREHEKLP
jgi:hypothetical protein